jgi:hypothetical protein
VIAGALRRVGGSHRSEIYSGRVTRIFGTLTLACGGSHPGTKLRATRNCTAGSVLHLAAEIVWTPMKALGDRPELMFAGRGQSDRDLITRFV